jgi:hypothetical protein
MEARGSAFAAAFPPLRCLCKRRPLPLMLSRTALRPWPLSGVGSGTDCQEVPHNTLAVWRDLAYYRNTAPLQAYGSFVERHPGAACFLPRLWRGLQTVCMETRPSPY